MIDAVPRMLLESSIRACAVAGAIALLLAVLRVKSSDVRHAAWTAGVAGMLLMPALPYAVPVVEVPPAVASIALDPIVPIVEWTQGNAFTSAGRGTPGAPASPMRASADRGSIATPSSVVMTSDPSGSRTDWETALTMLYLAGVVMMLTRIAIGFLVTRRITRASQRIQIAESAAALYECAYVAVPLTIGILRPRVVLPIAWRRWPTDNLRAIVTHEATHIRRGDPIVSFLARLNRAVFWFHPLAWWLERRLAVMAEQACDAAAVGATSDPRRYAQVLVEMADVVRAQGGRLSSYGIGVGGSGSLDARIDRVLANDRPRGASRGIKAAVAFGCLAAIVIAAACRRQPPPLAPDPKFTARDARYKAIQDEIDGAKRMTPADVAALEAAWNKNPEDFAALKKLLIYYGPYEAPADRAGVIAARRRLILWLIEHHPEHELHEGWSYARISPNAREWRGDLLGYEQGKALWMTKVHAPDTSPVVLGHAAAFIEHGDRRSAEQLLVRARERDTDRPRWTQRLATLYAKGLTSETSDPAEREAIRRTLAESNDPVLLTSVASNLRYSGRRPSDAMALAKTYIARALEHDPQSISANRLALQLLGHDEHQRYPDLRGLSADERYAKVTALPESDQLRLLPNLAQETYWAGDSLEYYKKDMVRARAEWDLSAKYAEQILAIAAKLPNDPHAAFAVHKAHMVVGAKALRDGDTRSALAHLRAAADVPATEELLYAQGIAVSNLPRYLLKEGEREAVIDFLERMAKINMTERTYLLESAQAIRKGVMPSWYQATIGRESQ